MATLNPEIFRAYDIRGLYGTDFDAAFAQRMGTAFAEHLRGPLVIARDARRSSDDLAYAFIDGAVHAGAHVFDIGETTSPQFYWAVRARGAAGGVIITASHNPTEYNGLKLVMRRGDHLEVIGGDQVRQIFDGAAHAHRATGSIESADTTADYAAAIAYAAQWRGGQELRCAVDAPAAELRILERLGPIAPDDGFAVRLDTDADRINFFIRGSELPVDAVFLALVEGYALSPVVFDLRFSRIVRETLDRRGATYALSRVGRLYLARAMQEHRAQLGAELSGHYYWKTMGGMECPELTLLKLYQLCDGDPTRLWESLAPYRRYVRSPELNIPLRDRKHAHRIIEQLAQQFPDGIQDHTDGLSVDYPEWWFNIRPSNTEPVMRLVVEANSKELLDLKVGELRKLVS